MAPLDVKATRELMRQVESWLVYRCAEERELWKIVPVCLVVIEKMARAIERSLKEPDFVKNPDDPELKTTAALRAALAMVKR